MWYVVPLAAVSDPRPSDNDVVAGWQGALVFVLLIAAVAFLCWSFTRQLKKVRAAREAGVYDDPEDSHAAPAAGESERNSADSGS